MRIKVSLSVFDEIEWFFHFMGQDVNLYIWKLQIIMAVSVIKTGENIFSDCKSLPSHGKNAGSS